MSLLYIALEACEEHHGFTKQASMANAQCLYLANVAYEMSKQASMYNVPYVKALAGKVSQNTLDVWRKTHNLAKRSATPDMIGYYNHIGEAAQKAQGESRLALEGVQRIIRHSHSIPGPRPVADLNMLNSFQPTVQH